MPPLCSATDSGGCRCGRRTESMSRSVGGPGCPPGSGTRGYLSGVGRDGSRRALFLLRVSPFGGRWPIRQRPAAISGIGAATRDGRPTRHGRSIDPPRRLLGVVMGRRFVARSRTRSSIGARCECSVCVCVLGAEGSASHSVVHRPRGLLSSRSGRPSPMSEGTQRETVSPAATLHRWPLARPQTGPMHMCNPAFIAPANLSASR